MRQENSPVPPAPAFEEAGSRNPWIRRAAAACYFHSGMPLLVRGLRERYELTANGGGPRFCIRRRNQPCARILYYHRVNDEQDPFFEATPTSVFENQMRYIARHYRVLSLGEIVRRLECGGPPEMLVGITFDDGYLDNYQNALPILKRYNLPATLFLTTGTIDSSMPLWFERLAEAIKRSTRTFIDVESVHPNRFWLRTDAERLESNRKLFSFLRGLEDKERNRSLQEIVARLEPSSQSERRNKMLTWDHARSMTKHGIHFGGHTVTHPFLSRLTPSQAHWEVSECKRRIEDELQEPVEHFAYPHGRQSDFSPVVKSALRGAGYCAAMTTIWGMNTPSTDRMELRRGGPWEDSAALFAWKLDWYQLVNE
jgi:peptidoglycan/xylan/chitin deacetylase (PgdA/CDA1 family)